MKILDVTNQDDGSALLTIDIDEEEMRLLMEAGLNKVLADYIEEMKNVPIGDEVVSSEQEKGSDN